MLRKFLPVLFLLIVSGLTACGQTSSRDAASPEPAISPQEAAASESDQSDYFWQLKLVHAEVADNLANTQTFILYGGSTEDVEYAKTASEGYTFLLLELDVDKNGVGGRPFSWADVYVEDGQGNQYRRMENDVFLEDYDLPRLKATDLTIGNNSGYICLEIPADTDVSGLQLVHEAEEGRNILPISLE